MKTSHPNENIIRQYLLGKLNDQKELEEELSKQMFFDDDLSQMVDSIEDEILDEYLDGTLSPADMQAVKEYFLCPQERKDKLQFARVMRTYFETNSPTSVSTQTALPPWQGIGSGPTVLLRSHARTYVEIAALILLSVCLLYIGQVRRQLQPSSAENQKILQRLEEERQHSASLEQRVAYLESPQLTLSNRRPRGGSRDIDMKHLEIEPSTQIIRVRIALDQPATAGPFDVALEDQAGGSAGWSKADVPSSKGILTFDMPSQGLQVGNYAIAVRPHGQPGGEIEHYDFRVTVTK